MPRPGLLLRALAAATALTALAPLTAHAAAPVGAASDRTNQTAAHAGASVSTPASQTTPLAVTIDRLSPATIPRHGQVRVAGTVTNDDTTTWTDIHVYPFISGAPMTTTAELAQAAASDPTLAVGSRITSVGEAVGDLAPGQSVSYAITIPRDELVYNDPVNSSQSDPITRPGVYWFGVHALGASVQGSDNVADGRARTFLPLVPHTPNAVPAKVALLLPIRRLVRLAPDGSVADLPGWTEDLTNGQLARIVSFGSGNLAVTWLVDPAVLDAVRTLAAGNPPRNLSPDTGSGASASPSPGGGAGGGATGSPSPSAAPTPSGAPEDPQTAAARQAAQAWLARFRQATTNHEVLALPYADPDLSALATHLPAAYPLARTLSDAVFKELGITATPVVAPLSGYLSAHALAMVGSTLPVLIGSQAVPGAPGGQVETDGTVLSVLDSEAAQGGPQPGDPLAPVALRQRILAQAALRYNQPDQTVVVALPNTWIAPRTPAAFGRAFAANWVSLQSFSATEAGLTPWPISADQLLYPTAEAHAQVAPVTLAQVRSLMATGTTLDDVLPEHHAVADQVAGQALTSTSYSARGGDDGAAMLAQQDIEAMLARVHIDAPPAVTLSSASGRFSVTVANGMPQTVSVQLRALTDGGILVTGPQSLRIAAGDSTSVLLSADARTNGVHQITLQLVDSAGRRFGEAVHFPVRSSEVSGTIWLFIGVGVGLLLLAIAVRLVRRIRTARRTARAEAP